MRESYRIHHSEGVTMTLEGGKPDMGTVFSSELERLLGPFEKDYPDPFMIKVYFIRAGKRS